MKTIAAARFKEQCLALLDRLEPDGLVVTKHGKPVAIVKPAGRSSAELIGSLASKIKARGALLGTGVKSLMTRDARIRRSKLVPLA